MSDPDDRPALDISALRRAQRALPGWSARRQRAFEARVLSRTTRQDLSWRGDVRLLLEYLGRRLAASPALRWVTVALALQLGALPVLALLAFYDRAPAARPLITFELPSDSPFAAPVPAEPTDPTDPVGPTGPWSPECEQALRAEAAENAIARARYQLPLVTVPVLASGTEADPGPVRWLERRARGLRELHFDLPAVAPGASLLERALALEVALDQWVLQGVAAPIDALERLGSEAPQAGSDPGLELATLALARARAYGLADPMAPIEAGEPCSRAWRAALERAGRATGLARHPSWRAWSDPDGR